MHVVARVIGTRRTTSPMIHGPGRQDATRGHAPRGVAPIGARRHPSGSGDARPPDDHVTRRAAQLPPQSARADWKFFATSRKTPRLAVRASTAAGRAGTQRSSVAHTMMKVTLGISVAEIVHVLPRQRGLNRPVHHDIGQVSRRVVSTSGPWLNAPRGTVSSTVIESRRRRSISSLFARREVGPRGISAEFRGRAASCGCEDDGLGFVARFR